MAGASGVSIPVWGLGSNAYVALRGPQGSLKNCVGNVPQASHDSHAVHDVANVNSADLVLLPRPISLLPQADAHLHAQLAQTYVTTGSELGNGTFMVCYATSASAGDAENDFIGQLTITVVEPVVTFLAPENAKPQELAVGVGAKCDTDAPVGDYVALVPSASANCAGA